MIKLPKLPRKLDAQMIYALVLSFVFAAAVYFIVYGTGCYMIDHVYMSEKSVAERKASIYSRFSSFVSNNALSSSDSSVLAHWSNADPDVTILLYVDQKLDSRITRGMTEPASNMQSAERTALAAQYGKLYPVRFADGVQQIAIGDNSQARKYPMCRVIAAAAAVTTIIIIMLWYIRRLTSRIIALSREAVEIGAGDLERPITVSGEDEITSLATEVDFMRRSVIERMGSESRAWQANAELITAISHDIRTPMTSLIGYLGLLNERGFDDPAHGKQFATSAYGKAMELKDLTDELFKYFLVFGKTGIELNMEPYDARLLTEQLLAELEFDIMDAGFRLTRIDFEGECSITVDPMYVKRVFDNFVSNIKKYADPAFPVVSVCELKDGHFSVCVSNVIRRSMEKVESTKIGLRTCARILELMGGELKTASDVEHFSAEIILPAG